MDKCRACLATDVYLIPMDVSFLQNFTLLTGLSIRMSDNSLYMCNTCCDAVKYFMEFRTRCIESDLSFQDMLVSVTVQEIKYDSEIPNRDCILPFVKEEIKSELNSSQENDNEIEYCSETGYDDTIINNKSVSKKRKVSDQTKNNVSKEKVKRKMEIKSIMKERLIDSKIYCGLCDSKFDDRNELNKHLQYHKSLFDTQITCGLCTERFVNLPHMLGHRLEHVPGDQRVCHICSKKFIASSATCLEFHYMRAHGMADKDAQIQCKQCTSSYPTSRKLIRHVRDCHSPPRYVCQLCSKGFRNRTLLNVHTKMKHTDGKRVQCKLCDFTSKYANSLMLHTRRKHTSNTFNCKACYRVFLDESSLSRHVADVCKHHARVVCAVCGHSVKKVWLKHHMRSHSDEYPFKCGECAAQYKYRTGLAEHAARHAGGRAGGTGGAFRCARCGKTFCARSALRSHARTHSDEKPFVCDICKVGFKRRYNLKAHMNHHPWSAASASSERKNDMKIM